MWGWYISVQFPAAMPIATLQVELCFMNVGPFFSSFFAFLSLTGVFCLAHHAFNEKSGLFFREYKGKEKKRKMFSTDSSFIHISLAEEVKRYHLQLTLKFSPNNHRRIQLLPLSYK